MSNRLFTNPVHITQEEIEYFATINPAKQRLIANSVGKSGTTWMRGILSTLPGYRSVDVHRRGFTGGKISELYETEPGEVFHGHLLYREDVIAALEDLKFRGVVIYRDIRDAIVSEYHHHCFLTEDSQAKQYLANMSKEQAFMAEEVAKWCGAAKKFRVNVEWLKYDGIAHIKYEDLRLYPMTTLHRLFRKIEIEIPLLLIEKIVFLNSFEYLSKRESGVEKKGHALRKGIVGDWKNHMSPQNIASLEKEFSECARRLGYEW